MKKLSLLLFTLTIISLQINLAHAYSLIVQVAGFGTVTSNIGGLNCSATGPTCSISSLAAGSVVQLTATLGSAGRSIVWGGSCEGSSGNSCTLTVNSDTVALVGMPITGSEVALFARVNGFPGSITGSMSGYGCNRANWCTGIFPINYSEVFTATPSLGGAFSNWSRDCSGTGSSCSVQFDRSRIVEATFSPVSVPSAPSGLSVIKQFSSELDLTWIDNSSDEVGFAVEQAPSVSGPWSEIARVGINARYYPSTNLNPGTTYYFRVRSFNQQSGVLVYSSYSPLF